MSKTDEERIQELEEAIADINGRIPAHTIRPHIIMELEELEDELDKLKEKLREN